MPTAAPILKLSQRERGVTGDSETHHRGAAAGAAQVTVTVFTFATNTRVVCLSSSGIASARQCLPPPAVTDSGTPWEPSSSHQMLDHAAGMPQFRLGLHGNLVTTQSPDFMRKGVFRERAGRCERAEGRAASRLGSPHHRCHDCCCVRLSSID